MTTPYTRHLQSTLLIADIKGLIDNPRWSTFVTSKDTLIPSIEILAELKRALKKAQKMADDTLQQTILEQEKDEDN